MRAEATQLVSGTVTPEPLFLNHMYPPLPHNNGKEDRFLPAWPWKKGSLECLGPVVSLSCKPFSELEKGLMTINQPVMT